MKRAARIALWICALGGIAVPCGFAQSSPSSSAKAAKCIEEGKRLVARANEETRKSQKQFEQALEQYLCAAKEGNAEGAFLAVDLSGGGMAPALPDSMRLRLMLQAANGGFSDAYFWLANLEKTRNPKEALVWLSKAKRSDTTGTASKRMADIFLSGQPGVQDSARAFACLREVGSKSSMRRMRAMLVANPTLDTSSICEPKP